MILQDSPPLHLQYLIPATYPAATYPFFLALADVQRIFSKSILRELLLKSARCKSLNVSKSFVGLRHLATSTGDKLVRCLPALRALTGCDTTSKIATKHAVMKAIHNNLTLIQNFKSLTTQS